MTMRGTTISMLGLVAFVLASLNAAPARAVEEWEPPARPPRSFDDDERRPQRSLAGPQRPRGPAFEDDEFGSDRRERRARMKRRMGRDRPGPSEERIDEIMTILSAKLPGLHARLAMLREDNAEEFRGAFRRLMPLFREYYGLSEHHPELADTVFEEFRIERELRQLSDKYKTAQASENADMMARVESEIRERVGRQFDIRMQRRGARLAEFGERIEAQQKKHADERARFEQERGRIDELTDQRVERIKKGRMRDFSKSRHRGHRGPRGGKFGSRGGDDRSSRFGPGDGPPRGDRDFPRDRRGQRPPPRDDGGE